MLITSFYSNCLPTGKAFLHASGGVAIIGYWSTSKTMPSPITTVVTRKSDSTNVFCGSRMSVLEELIRTFTTKNEWVMAVYLNNGKVIMD